MAASTIKELEDRMDAELGTIRNSQLEEIERAHARERSAKAFRKEVRGRLGTLETGMTELKTDVAELKTGMATILELLRAKA